MQGFLLFCMGLLMFGIRKESECCISMEFTLNLSSIFPHLSSMPSYIFQYLVYVQEYAIPHTPHHMLHFLWSCMIHFFCVFPQANHPPTPPKKITVTCRHQCQWMCTFFFLFFTNCTIWSLALTWWKLIFLINCKRALVPTVPREDIHHPADYLPLVRQMSQVTGFSVLSRVPEKLRVLPAKVKKKIRNYIHKSIHKF